MRITERLERIKKNYEIIQKVVSRRGANFDWSELLYFLDSPQYARNPKLVMSVMGECYDELCEFKEDVVTLQNQFRAIQSDAMMLMDFAWDLESGRSIPLPSDIDRLSMYVEHIQREF